jgi:hypothetical protein
MRFGIAAPLAALACLAVGCGPDDATTSSDDAVRAVSTAEQPAELLPDAPGAPLQAGRYRTSTFRPGMGLTLPAGWRTVGSQSTDQFAIEHPDTGARIAVARVVHVFDPRKGGAGPADAVDAPQNLRQWLGRHPRLKARVIGVREVANVGGEAVQATVRSVPHRRPACSGNPCLPLYLDDAGGQIAALYTTETARFIVLDFEQEQLLVDTRTTHAPDGFAEIDEVLATMRFESP